MTIAERIRTARKNAGLTQRELGALLGVTQATVGQYENGTRNPKTETLQRFADALGVDFAALIGADVLLEAAKAAYDANRRNAELMQAFIPYYVDLATKGAIYGVYADALKASDVEFIASADNMSDDYILQTITDIFTAGLNRRGKLEALSRIQELSEIERFQDPEYAAAMKDDTTDQGAT